MQVVDVALENILIEIDFEDLEDCGKSGRDPRRAKSYRIIIDRLEKVVHRHEMTGREILNLVGKSAEKFTLTEKLHGGARVRIEPDEIVVFHRHKVERFETAPRSASNGEMNVRGPLGSDDVEYLNASGYAWKLVPFPVVGQRGSAGHALILIGYRLPAAFRPTVVDLMIRIPMFYPATGLDMFNTNPAVARADARSLPALSFFQFEGRPWQQWSRHRLPDDPWNPVTDCLATHMSLVESAMAADAR
jgi:hypothetical protein